MLVSTRSGSDGGSNRRRPTAGTPPEPTATRDVSAIPRGSAHEEPTPPARAPKTGPGSFPQSGFSG